MGRTVFPTKISDLDDNTNYEVRVLTTIFKNNGYSLSQQIWSGAFKTKKCDMDDGKI